MVRFNISIRQMVSLIFSYIFIANSLIYLSSDRPVAFAVVNSHQNDTILVDNSRREENKEKIEHPILTTITWGECNVLSETDLDNIEMINLQNIEPFAGKTKTYTINFLGEHHTGPEKFSAVFLNEDDPSHRATIYEFLFIPQETDSMLRAVIELTQIPASFDATIIGIDGECKRGRILQGYRQRIEQNFGNQDINFYLE